MSYSKTGRYSINILSPFLTSVARLGDMIITLYRDLLHFDIRQHPLAYIHICDIPEVFTESKTSSTRVARSSNTILDLNTLCSTGYLLNRSEWALKSYAKLISATLEMSLVKLYKNQLFRQEENASHHWEEKNSFPIHKMS